MIVCKFGGTSVQDAAAIERVAGIIGSRLRQKPLVVASAMGKTTNALLQAAQLAAEGKRKDALDVLGSLRRHHLAEASKLGIPEREDDVPRAIHGCFEEMESLIGGLAVLGELTPRSMDAMASYGERLSTVIIARALRDRGVPTRLLDSRKFVITDENFTRAAPLFDLTDPAIIEQVLPVVKAGEVPVIQGFVGATRKGVTTTIGRGGSDYSAAIIGAALEAYGIQIWTDVDGIMTTDPRMVPDAKRVRVISFDEAAELAYFGAKVLHPATILPAVRKKIPVRVLNSYRPDVEGTVITDEAPACNNPVKSIAFKKGITVVNITSTRMLMAYGFLRAIFEIFDRHRVPVDVVSTSEVSVSLTLDDTSRIWDVVTDLKNIGDVKAEGSKAIVCCVGDRLEDAPGIPHRIFSALQGIKVEMISQGASSINVTFVIDEDCLPRAVRSLHDEFFDKTDPVVFE